MIENIKTDRQTDMNIDIHRYTHIYRFYMYNKAWPHGVAVSCHLVPLLTCSGSIIFPSQLEEVGDETKQSPHWGHLFDV